MALREAVNAWVGAPRVLRLPSPFAGSSGGRSYQDVALFVASAVGRPGTAADGVSGGPLSGLAYLMQGWLVGSEGFSPTYSVAIVLAWTLSIMWMIWLAVVVWRMPAGAGAE